MKLTRLATLFALAFAATVYAAPDTPPDKAGVHAGTSQQFTLNGSGTYTASGVVYTVPAGKRLVIENASANCATGIGEKVRYSYLYFNNSGTNASHIMVPVFTGEYPNIASTVASWSGRLYADAGPIQIGATKIGSISGPAYACYFSISGYLVSVP